jgi:hypothetical protein
MKQNEIDIKQNKHILMSRSDYTKLPDHPVQRDITARDLDHLSTFEQDHLEVSALLVTKEFIETGSGKIYEKGYVCKNDGHGRSYMWDVNSSDIKPSHVTVTFYEVDSWEKMESMYDHTDSATAVEKTAEKFIARLKKYDVHIEDPTLKKLQPIGYAANLIDPIDNPKASGLSTAQINEAVKLLHPQYKVINDEICSGSDALHRPTLSRKFVWNNIITMAVLIALYGFKVTPELLDLKDTDDPLYNNARRLLDLISHINKGSTNCDASPWDARTQIVMEFNGSGHHLDDWHNNKTKRIPVLNAGSCVTCVSFILYWILQHMSGKRLSENMPNKSKWSKIAKDFPSEVQKKLGPIYGITEEEKLCVDNVFNINKQM